MSDKKHIDRVFQEKFRDFEATPSPEVWKGIQAKLDKKKKRKAAVIPLWYKIAGVAAVLALFFLGGNMILNVNNSTPSFVDTEIQPLDKTSTPESPNKTKETGVSAKKNFSNEGLSSSNALVRSTNDDSISNENAVQKRNKTLSTTLKEQNITSTESNASSIVSATKAQQETTNGKVSSISKQTNSEAKTLLNDRNFEGNKSLSVEDGIPSTTEDDKAYNNVLENTTVAQEEFLEDDILKTNQSIRRWAVRPNVAPIYYDGFGEGSSIDPQLADNSSSGDVSLSYGIQVSYEINKNLKLRSGVSQITHSYTTNEIAFVPSTQAVGLRNVNQRLENGLLVNIIDLNTNKPRSSANPLSSDGEVFGRDVDKLFRGSLNQQLGYIEVPLELEYTLVNTRLGLSVIGGASTLFLNENNISAESGGNVSNVGKANNINSLSFSTNVGLGLGYKISEKFQFNLEPTFKYQINTFSNTTDFNPYYLGLYTGFSFKF